MDFNHDYDGTNELLIVGSKERLQACKCVILAFGDLGYTDPPIPSLGDAIGDYTDFQGIASVKRKIHDFLLNLQEI